MYNRYIPQPDGSFQRAHVPEPPPPPEHRPPCPQPSVPPPPPEPPVHGSVPGFLRSLIPAGFDTGDLIVVLLLLLLAGDCEEDRTHALLTLALYLFL